MGAPAANAASLRYHRSRFAVRILAGDHVEASQIYLPKETPELPPWG